MTTVRILRTPIARGELASIAKQQFGDMVKAVVDVKREVMAVAGELHSDEEASLMDDGSGQQDLWGINLYPGESQDEWIEFDSVINIRPSQGNRSRGVDDPERRRSIIEIVSTLITE